MGGQEGVWLHQGLDAGGPEGEEGPGREGLRGCQEGHRAVQGGQGHLQRMSGAPKLDATATDATLGRARLARLQQGSWLFTALLGSIEQEWKAWDTLLRMDVLR